MRRPRDTSTAGSRYHGFSTWTHIGIDGWSDYIHPMREWDEQRPRDRDRPQVLSGWNFRPWWIFATNLLATVTSWVRQNIPTRLDSYFHLFFFFCKSSFSNLQPKSAYRTADLNIRRTWRQIYHESETVASKRPVRLNERILEEVASRCFQTAFRPITTNGHLLSRESTYPVLGNAYFRAGPEHIYLYFHYCPEDNTTESLQDFRLYCDERAGNILAAFPALKILNVVVYIFDFYKSPAEIAADQGLRQRFPRLIASIQKHVEIVLSDERLPGSLSQFMLEPRQ